MGPNQTGNPRYGRPLGGTELTVAALHFRYQEDSLLVMAALVVTGAWLTGRAVFSPGDVNGFGRIAFGWFDVVPNLLIGAVLAVPGAYLLRDRRRGLRWAGTGLVVVATLAMSYLAFVDSFGGICFDAGEDVCVVTQPAYLTHLLLPLAILTVGWAIAHRPQRSAG